MSKIAEELRMFAAVYNDDEGDCEMLIDGANEIERLEREAAELREALDKMLSWASSAYNEYEDDPRERKSAYLLEAFAKDRDAARALLKSPPAQGASE